MMNDEPNSRWPSGRSADGGLDRVPLPSGSGAVWMCGKHRVGPDPEDVLRIAGATTIVCLTQRDELVDRYPGYVAWLDRHQPARAVWLPVADLSAPPFDVFVAQVRGLRDRLGRGEHLVVHCGAGIGRAGTYVVALLMTMGMPEQQALDHVRASRPMAGPEVGAQKTLIETLSVHLRETVQAERPTC
jgi:hypothetical protein